MSMAPTRWARLTLTTYHMWDSGQMLVHCVVRITAIRYCVISFHRGAEALAVVERWNAALAAERGALWSPMIRCAINAGAPWLDVHCPGCRTSRRSTFAPLTAIRLPLSEASYRAAVLVVSGISADAQDRRCAAASGEREIRSAGRRVMLPHARLKPPSI